MEYALTILFQKSSRTVDMDRELFNIRQEVRRAGWNILAESTRAPCFVISDGIRDARTLVTHLRTHFDHAGLPHDPIVQPLEIARKPKRLVIFDMDSTLIRAEVIDEYGREMGIHDQIATITASAMRGEIDFDASFTRRMALLKGLPELQAHGIWDRIPIMEGAEWLFKTLRLEGVKTAVVTGGFRHIAEKLQEKFQIDHVLANEMPFKEGICTGQVIPPIINAQAKVAELSRLRAYYGLEPAEVMAVGDGANDIPMLLEAGLGVAVHAKPAVIQAVGNVIRGKSLEPLTRLLQCPL